MEKVLGLALIVLAQAQWTHSQITSMFQPASYMALHPVRFSVGDEFPVYVKLLRPLSYEKVEASLWFHNYSSNETVIVSSDVISLSNVKMEGTIYLKIKDDREYNWQYMKLNLTGSGMVTFNHESEKDIRSERRSLKDEYIFIQTDKRMYKSGQLVHYRVFIVDRDMMPIDRMMSVYIQDPKDNRIQKHVNVSSSLGFSDEVQLGEFVTLGVWKIMAETEKTKEEMYFQVEEYVLPKFEVSLDLPPFGTLSNPELRGKVIAKYTYGKPVEGKVTLTVTKLDLGWNWGFHPIAVQTQFEIDGEADFAIPTATLLKFDPTLKHDTLKVHVSVTERETHETQMTSKLVNFYVADVELAFFSDGWSEDSFKPGFEYTLYFKVTQPDGRPFQSFNERARITMTYITDTPNTAYSLSPPMAPGSNLMKFIAPFTGGDVIFLPDMQQTIPHDGVGKLTLTIPEKVVTAHIEIHYRDKVVTKNVQKFRTNSKAYLDLNLKSAFVKIGQQAMFTVSCNVVQKHRVTYHIINQGRIVQTHFTHTSGHYAITTFYVTMTTAMAPSSYIVAHVYDEENNEIIADGLEFSVDSSKFAHEVHLRFDRSRISPGENVTLHADATPGSHVFLMAVDKSAILQASGNDVTKERVHSALQTKSQEPWKYGQDFLSRKLRADDSQEVFFEASINIMTDANISSFDLSSLVGEAQEKIPVSKPEVSYSHREIDHNEMYHHHSEVKCWNNCPTLMYDPPGAWRRERTQFPETWIWANGTASANGAVDVNAEVPDTITDWVATAFALSPKTGLGVVEKPANLTVFLPFFVSLRLPFSIVADEVASIQALVFNYYSYDLYVTVTLESSNSDFMGIVVDHQGHEMDEKGDLVKCVLVKANDVSSVYFTIKPMTIGTVNLKVTASSTRGKDSIVRPLLVKAAGHQEEFNTATLISVDGGSDFRTEIPISYPPRIVLNSHRIRISLIGDVFGPSLDHLGELTDLPAGSGEQTMVHFAPAVSAARYLNSTGRFNGEEKDKVLHNINTGYQRQLLYQRYDGSFSAFGTADDEGSLWLTALVLKSFSAASDFIYIDPDIIVKATEFVLNRQNKDGTFNNSGTVYHKAMQGASGSTNRSHMAYMLITLKEVIDSQSALSILPAELQSRLQQAVLVTWSNLNDNIGNMADDYEMAISAYALALMSRGGSSDLLQKLDKSPNFVKEDNTHHWKNRFSSHEVEIAAYVLLTHAHSGNVQEGLPVLKWLLKQRNSYGGFVSTQATVVGLQSLAEFASRIYTPHVNLTIRIEAGSESRDELHLTSENMDVLQFFEITSPVYSVHVHATGTGKALLEVSLFYNILDEFKRSNFELNLNVNGTEPDNFTLTACARYLGAEDSGMVLMDIGFPSGFYFVPETRLVVSGQSPKREEVTRGRLVLYFDKLHDITCINVTSRRDYFVGHVKPADVRIYSNSNPETAAMNMYLPTSLKTGKMCDVCGLQCGCGFDPEAVSMERCTGRMAYPSPTRNMVVSGQRPTVGSRAKSSLPMNALSWNRRRTTRYNPFQRGVPPVVVRRTSTVNRG